MKTITFDETKWKLVPIEPTKEMDRAAMRKTSQASYGDAIDAYSAMLSAAPEYEPEADEDGWIKWDGGDCPIGLDQMVDVMFRDKQEFHSESADEWRWDHDFGGGDIVAYRITK